MAQRIAQAYTSYTAEAETNARFRAMAEVYQTLVANFSGASGSESKSVREALGQERSFTTRLTWLVGSLRCGGRAIHQPCIGAGYTASDIIWLDEAGFHLWNVECKREGGTVDEVLGKSRTEGTNQACRLPTLVKDWQELCGVTVTVESGLYPFLLSYWAPALLVVTLCIPCYGESALELWR